MQLLRSCFPFLALLPTLSSCLQHSRVLLGGSGGDTGGKEHVGKEGCSSYSSGDAAMRGLQPTDRTARHDPEQMCSGH